MNEAGLSETYDGLGWFYDRHWSGIASRLLPVLNRLMQLPRAGSILDMCCGTGHLTAALCRRGFRVTGLDASEDMLKFARRNAPAATFFAADARSFSLRESFDAVISTGDSFNHLLTPDDLDSVVHRVYQALRPDGLLVFDVNTREAYVTQWRKASTTVEPDNLVYVRGAYDRTQRIGTTQITTFRFNGSWQRLDITLRQRCHSRAEIRAALTKAGFCDVRMRKARELGMQGRMAIGRLFVTARKPDAPSLGVVYREAAAAMAAGRSDGVVSGIEADAARMGS